MQVGRGILRPIQIAIAIAGLVLLATASEASAAEFGNPASGNAPYLWSGSDVSSSKSPGQKTSNLGAPSQEIAPVRDLSAARAADELAAASKPGEKAYRIGPLDVLDISVFQAPELSKTVEVASNGTVDLPLVGETPAAGRSTYELQRELNSKFGAKYLQNPQVTVTVKQFNSSRVTISGAVKNPGVFPYKGESLLQYIAMAGGLTDLSNKTVLVIRHSNGTRSAAKFDTSDIESGRVQDPPMQAGDMIVADTSVMKKGLNAILKVLPLAAFAGI
jgi:polysaccharide export outer membrane protein